MVNEYWVAGNTGKGGGELNCLQFRTNFLKKSISSVATYKQCVSEGRVSAHLVVISVPQKGPGRSWCHTGTLWNSVLLVLSEFKVWDISLILEEEMQEEEGWRDRTPTRSNPNSYSIGKIYFCGLLKLRLLLALLFGWSGLCVDVGEAEVVCASPAIYICDLHIELLWCIIQCVNICGNWHFQNRKYPLFIFVAMDSVL